MKKTLISLLSAACVILDALTCGAQTNGNPISTTLQPYVGSGVATTLGYLYDAQPYLTNGTVLVESGALKSGSHYGAFADIQFPVSTNSWQLTYGTAFGYVNKSFYSAALSVSLGTTITPPLIGNITGPFYLYAETGPGYNFRAHQLVSQNFAGLKYIHEFSGSGWLNGCGIGASYGIGKISDVKDTQQEFAISFSVPWKKVFGGG